MAVIAQTNSVAGNPDAVALTQTTTTSADTLAYVPGAHQRLTLVNTTGSPITITLAGTTGSTLQVTGYGSVAATAGKAVTVAANTTKTLDLDAISAYLAGSGTVNLTGGAGLIATLFV
jgi:hypothetical protein